MKILQNMWFSKLGCHGKVNVDVHLATTLKCFQIIFSKTLQYFSAKSNFKVL